MGGDGGYFKGPGGDSPLDIQTDHIDDGETYGGGGVVIYPGGGGTIRIRITLHTGAHLKTAGNY